MIGRKRDLRRHKYHLLPLYGFVVFGSRGRRLDERPRWIVPILWRSDFRNALAGAIRQRSLTVEEASVIANLAEVMLDQEEFTVSTSAVLHLVSTSNCSAYEFVALAQAEGVR